MLKMHIDSHDKKVPVVFVMDNHGAHRSLMFREWIEINYPIYNDRSKIIPLYLPSSSSALN